MWCTEVGLCLDKYVASIFRVKKKSVDLQQTTRHYIPHDRTLDNHCCENFKSNKLYSFFKMRQRLIIPYYIIMEMVNQTLSQGN